MRIWRLFKTQNTRGNRGIADTFGELLHEVAMDIMIGQDLGNSLKAVLRHVWMDSKGLGDSESFSRVGDSCKASFAIILFLEGAFLAVQHFGEHHFNRL